MKKSIVKYDKLFMSFDTELGYQYDVIDSILEYAMKASELGSDYVRKNLISCKSANSCRIFWEIEPAEEGDKFYKFCCGAKNSDIVVNGFINSRKCEDSNSEILYVRLLLCHNSKNVNKQLFRSHSGEFRSFSQAQDYDNVWYQMAGYECDTLDDSNNFKKSA